MDDPASLPRCPPELLCEMETCCLKNTPFKILLIVDNNPGHLPFIGDLI